MKLNATLVVSSFCFLLAACGGGNGMSKPEQTGSTASDTHSGVSTATVSEPGGATSSYSYQALDARFNRPLAIAADASGTLYVAGDGTVRKIVPGSGVSTIAGAAGQFGTTLSGGADGKGSMARFNVLSGIAVGSDSNLYVADTFANTGKIRKIAQDGTVSTLRSGFYALGIATDVSGNIHFTDNVGLYVATLSLTGEIKKSGRISGGPRGIAADQSGNLYVTNTGQVYRPLGQTAFSCTVEKILPSGQMLTLAGAAAKGEFENTCGYKDAQGTSARIGKEAHGIAVDSTGNVYFTDTLEHTIRKIAPDGTVTTIAGMPGSAGSSDGTGSSARFNEPRGIAIAGDGNLYVADTENHTIRKVTPAGVVTTIAGKAGESGSTDVAVTASAMKASPAFQMAFRVLSTFLS